MTKITDAVDIGAIRAKITADISGFEAGISKAKAKTSELGHAAHGAEASFMGLNMALKDVGASSKQIDNINTALRKANPELLRKQIASVASELSKLGASNADIAKITAEMEKSALGAGTLTKEVKGLGVAYAGLAVAMGAIITKSIQTSAQFEQAMANVKAITEATGAEFDKLRAQAIQLGAATVFSASQAADAQANLAQAGFKTNEIIAAMPGVLSLAAAGQVDLATTADIASSILRGFGLAATDTGRVVDVLAKSSIDTNSGISDLGYAMKYVAPVAANMGVSIEEATAAIGELSNAGIKGEMAGTQLRAILLALASPSKEAAAYMDKLGFSIKDSAGNIKPLSTIVGDLQKAYGRLTQAQQADVAATLVGREAASGFITLINNGKTSLDNYTASLQNAGGTAERVAGTQMDTLKGATDNLSSALESVGITVGDKLAPAIRAVAEFVTNLLTGFTNLSAPLQSAIVAFGMATAGILGLAAAVGALSIAFTALNVSFPILGAIALAVGAVTAGITWLVSSNNEAAEAVKKHDEAQQSLNETLNKSPLKNTTEDIEKMRSKLDEVNAVLNQHNEIQEKINKNADLFEKGQGDANAIIAETEELSDKLEEVDKQFKTLGYDSYDDAAAKAKELTSAIEESVPALLQEKSAEIAGLAAKNEKVKTMETLFARYKDLSSAQSLNAAQEQELASIIDQLRKQYPDLIQKLDATNRMRIVNVDTVEQQIKADRDFVNNSSVSMQIHINNLIATTQAQRAAVEAQIKNYAALLEAIRAVESAKAGPKKSNPETSGGLGQYLTPEGKTFMDARYDGMKESAEAGNQAAYDESLVLQQTEQELKRQRASLSSGNFGGKKVGKGVDLSTPKKAKAAKTPKEKKPKSGKSAAELAEEAAKKAYDADVATVRYKAEMYDWSADQQIAAFKRVQAAHKAYLSTHVEDERTMNLQLKRLAEDSAKSRYEYSAEWIAKDQRRMEDAGKSETAMAQARLDGWLRVLKQYKKGSDEYKQASEEVYKAQKELAASQFEDSEEWIAAEERRMRDAGKSEEEIEKMKIAAWTRVRSRYAEDTEFYKKADEEIYQSRKSLTEKVTESAADLVKKEKAAVEKAKKADLDAIEARKKAYVDAQDVKIKAIDAQIAKEAELNSDADYETQLAEKRARLALLASAVGPDGIKEREDLAKEIDRMQLEHDRDLRKRDLEAQKDALQDEKDTKVKAFDDEKDATTAQYDALAQAFDDYAGDIKTIEAAISSFRVGENASTNAKILAELDTFVAQYNAKMGQITSVNSGSGSDAELAEYNSNKDAYEAAKARGDSAEMARLAARNEAIRKQHGIVKDTGKLQSFKDGGIIQGASGSPVMVQAHAGEIVLNPQQQAALWSTLSAPSMSAGPTVASPVITNHIDMSVNDVALTDKADIQTLYSERERVAARIQAQGVKL